MLLLFAILVSVLTEEQKQNNQRLTPITWAEPSRHVAAPCNLCGSDSERKEAGRSACRAAHQIRIHYQFECGEAARPDDPTERAGESGQGD
jgi:hypothetical protein